MSHSSFHAYPKHTNGICRFPKDVAGNSRLSDQEDTDDEEVKMSCLVGECGMHDSDLSYDGNEVEDSSVDENDERDQSREDGVVAFFSGRVQQITPGSRIYRPTPVSPRPPLIGGESRQDSSARNIVEASQEFSDQVCGRKLSSPCSGESEVKDAPQDQLRECKVFGPQHDTNKTTAKRVLSSNALATDAESTPDSPKRIKPSISSRAPKKFFLGASTEVQVEAIQFRDASVLSSDEELDKRLSEELDVYASESSRENSPVPLLTPPQSPLEINVGESVTTVCEWPSNLAVDSAMMTAATEKFEEPELEETSSLTPLFRSIFVGTD